MATNIGAVSVTECAVCHEDFKQPKLLPCSHSYCLECLEKLAGETKKITCPECRKEIDVPDRGVGAFPENRYVEDLLKIKKTHQCMKHFLPLHIFCDNEDCQEAICATCATLKHNGHNLVDLEDKADAIKADMGTTNESVREISLELASHLDTLNAAIEEVNTSTSQNLDAVDETREKLHKKIKELHEKVQVETEKQKMELIQKQKSNLQKLNKAKEDTLNSKSLFDGLYMDIKKSMTTLSKNEIVQSKETVEKAFLDNKIKLLVNNNFDITVDKSSYKKQTTEPQLNFDDFGKLHEDSSYISPPMKIRQAAESTIKYVNMVPKANLLKTINTELEKWNFTKMCVSKDGRVVLSGKIGEDNWLKCMNAEGKCLWQMNVGKSGDDACQIRGLSCVGTGNEYFVSTRENYIELRNMTDGQIVCESHVGFSCDHLCSNDADTIFVRNRSTSPAKLVKFKIKYEQPVRLEQTDETIDTQLENPFGYAMLKYEGKQLLIVTSWKEKTIQAIDYETGEIVWKITGQYEGKDIHPHGVCHDDVGNLYVTDGTKKRVLVVSPEGKIKQKLTDMPGTPGWIGWLESQRLVVHYDTDKIVINTFQIDYVTP